MMKPVSVLTVSIQSRRICVSPIVVALRPLGAFRALGAFGALGALGAFRPRGALVVPELAQPPVLRNQLHPTFPSLFILLLWPLLLR